jgi:hypothetical protein
MPEGCPMSDTVTQLTAIHGMLSAGHRSLRIERHSLILWGIAGAALLVVSEHILTPQQFPDHGQRAVAWLVLLAVVITSVGTLDWHWTRRAKQARDETWSFVHRQILKVWWLLLAIGTLLTFAMFFFGGGYMVCSAWLVLLGLGLYMHGLFSEEVLEWTGALMIVLGILSLAMRLPFDTMRSITASVFGIGLPLLALFLDRGRNRPAWQRLAQTLSWILAVLALPLAAQSYASTTEPAAGPVMPLADYLKLRDVAGTHIVSLPAGTGIPIEFEISGDLFASSPQPELTLTLAQPVELVIVDGRLTGDGRLPGQGWLPRGQFPWALSSVLRAEITAARGPVVHTSLAAYIKHKPGL